MLLLVSRSCRLDRSRNADSVVDSSPVVLPRLLGSSTLKRGALPAGGQSPFDVVEIFSVSSAEAPD